MKNEQYGNGYKIVAILLQMVFLIIVIVIFSLMVSLYKRSMPGFFDIGNHSFFNSSFYMDNITEMTKELTVYIQLKDRVEKDEAGYEQYKQYKLKFDSEESNYYYWFSCGNRLYTNMPGQDTKDEAVTFAKELGSYFYYDDATITFQGNVKRTDHNLDLNIMRLFRQGRQGGRLVVGIDTSLAGEDAIAEAAATYQTYSPWVKWGTFFAVIAFLCFILTMIYLTLAAGKSDDPETIRLHRIDYVPTEVHFLFFLVCVIGLIAFCKSLNGNDWGISSTLILTGTLVFLTDSVFLTLYLSAVRKIKANIFASCSVLSFSIHTLKEGMRRRDIAHRALIWFVLCMAAELFFVWEALSKRRMWAIAGMLFVFVYPAVYFLQHAIERKRILEGIREISDGQLNYKFDVREFGGDYREMAEEINGIGEGLSNAVDENVKNERLKTELVTNVSHDIKTPLTSIINYISLIKMEGTWNKNVENYVSILEKKSQRLKQLTEDLVEVSKITSGTIHLDMQPINMVELICQTGGEFNEIFEDVGLTVVTRLPKDPVMILADGSRLWRVVQNLYNNVAKYALKDTRVFVELKINDGKAEFSIKDISAQGIQKTPQDLSERFVRGDESRGTEGSGLGLSIARHLTNLMGGNFDIQLDGDLFTVFLAFDVINP